MSDPTYQRRKRQIHLDRDNGWVFGVCAGLANYWQTDPAIVRVATIVTGLFMPKMVIAAYLIGWLFLDEGTSLRRS